MAFNAPEIDDVLKQVPLDDNYQAPEDIPHFIAERFDDTKRIHPLRRCLGPTWPAEECVEEIVIKSSGQFIYASVVIKFVSVPSSNPSTQLDIVRGLRPAVRMAMAVRLGKNSRNIFGSPGNIFYDILTMYINYECCA